MELSPIFLLIAGLITGLIVGWASMVIALNRTRQLLAKTQNEFASTTAYSSSLKEQLDTALFKEESLSHELASYRDKSVALDAQKTALEERIREQSDVLKHEFKDITATLFEDLSKKFSTSSEKQIGELLNPMQQHLNDFKKLVVESFQTQGKEQHTLRSEINKIILQADSLTKALRGDVKAQGNWGEVMLERILEASGLQKDIGYVVQGTAMGLVNADGGRALPDVIVNLPDNKHVIIDSKVSLVAYDRYCSATDELTREIQCKEFIKSIRAHASGLASKNYQDLKGLETPDLVLMFMPIEGAYSLAIQEDRELHSYAWDKRVAIVCPSTLFITLKTIASLWRIENQNKHADEIAKRGGALYDKIVGFLEDMQGIGHKMGGLQKDYDNAMSKLSQGNGNLISQAEKLRKLGAKTSKAIPKSLSVDSDAEEENA
jgi:DNA recombination protein RmuC